MGFREFLQETDPFSTWWIDELDLTWRESIQGSILILDVPKSMHEGLKLRQRKYLSTGASLRQSRSLAGQGTSMKQALINSTKKPLLMNNEPLELYSAQEVIALEQVVSYFS